MRATDQHKQNCSRNNAGKTNSTTHVLLQLQTNRPKAIGVMTNKQQATENLYRYHMFRAFIMKGKN